MPADVPPVSPFTVVHASTDHPARHDSDPDFDLTDHLDAVAESPTGVFTAGRSDAGHRLTFTRLLGLPDAPTPIDGLSDADLVQLRTVLDAYLSR